MASIYPRKCEKCGKTYKHRGDFSRHKKYCGTNIKVPCLHCDKVFSRKDALTAHVKKFHSEAAKRKAEENVELLKMELLHTNKVPRLSVEHQTGAMTSEKCGKTYKHKGDFYRHKKYCGTNNKVLCLHCDKVFSRKDALTAHVKKVHSEAVKRKAAETDELDRMELLHAAKVPRLSVDNQTGGAASTRGMKSANEEEPNPDVKATRGMKRANEEDPSPDVKAAKNDQEIEKSDTYEGGPNPLFQANIYKMGKPKSWKKGKIIDQKFTFTLDQLREEKQDEDLGLE